MDGGEAMHMRRQESWESMKSDSGVGMVGSGGDAQRALEEEMEEIKRQQKRKRTLKLAAKHFNAYVLCVV